MAIVVTLMLTFALGALALSAVFLSSGTRIASGLSNRAADLQYAADAALQMGKSYINADPTAMPSSGYREITFNGGVLNDASGAPIPGIAVRAWVGPTGATSGQFGAFGSLFAEATDRTGGKVVRRLELAQENFARFAYWSNREQNGGGPIVFGGGDVIFGPTWSNDTVRINAKGSLPFSAQFRDDFGTAKIILQPDQADFWKGYTQNGKPIPLPTPSALGSLPGHAASGRLNFTAPSSGNETTTRMRIEFVNIDIDNDGSDVDPQDGFVRVYMTGSGSSQAISWVRGDQEIPGQVSDAVNRRGLCGEWVNVPGFGDRFFTTPAHENPTVRSWLIARFQNAPLVLSASAATNMANALLFKGSGLSGSETQAVLSRNGSILGGNRSQCFLGGAPELNWNAYSGASYGGTSTSFLATDLYGAWQIYGGAVDARVVARRGAIEAQYLFPLHRSVNPGARGVINVTGTTGVSGNLSGRVTLHTTGTVVVLDDIKYSTNPATSGRCVDVLGILSDRDVVVADNLLNNQGDVTIGSGTTYRLMDDTKDLTLHAVVMTLNTSFRVERHALGPTSGNPCNGVEKGRGCLALLGGLIQEARGAVGTTTGTGFGKQYTYDRCANLRPPPYFPTTGRYLDNRYMEVDPVGFNILTTMARLAPAP